MTCIDLQTHQRAPQRKAILVLGGKEYNTSHRSCWGMPQEHLAPPWHSYYGAANNNHYGAKDNDHVKAMNRAAGHIGNVLKHMYRMYALQSKYGTNLTPLTPPDKCTSNFPLAMYTHWTTKICSLNRKKTPRQHLHKPERPADRACADI